MVLSENRLVGKSIRNGDFYDFPTSGSLTTSVNTPSQTSQTVGDFYDMIGGISTLNVLSQTVPDVSDFYDESEHKICLSGTIEGFYDECEHEICLSGTSGMLDFVFTCYRSLIFSKL